MTLPPTVPDPTTEGPLAGLRILDLTEELGRFGTKLLAEAGADVVRARGRGERGATMTDPAADLLGGVLDWWYDGGKSLVELDLDTPHGRDAYRALAAVADVIIETENPGRLADLGLDHADLSPVNPRLTQISLTPYGRTGPWSGWQSSDLVAGAVGGVLSITGLADQPLNSWGGQNHNFGGFAAAICALAGVRSARRTGVGQLVDLSLHEVVTGSIENLFMQYFFDDLLPAMPKVAKRQGSLHWLGLYEVAPAKTGNVMITPTPAAQPMVEWMLECGIEAARPFQGMAVEELLGNAPALMAAMRSFLLTKDAGSLFTEAQARHIAFGEVQSVAQAADNPQYRFRQLYGRAPLPDRPDDPGREGVTLPARLVRYTGTPVAGPRPPRPDALPADAVATLWAKAAARPLGGVGEPSDPPLTGLRVLDLSWVLAGPFATRILGDLGADVIKVQHEARATLVNQPDYPYYLVWNRSKRSATIDLKHPEALAVLRKLVEQSDVLVENYSSGVLSRLGLGWDDVRHWNERLVYVSMSGPGHEGPWKDVISYAPTIHALCGLTHLTNPEGRGDVGCGFSLNDHAAGFASAYSVLAALEAVERTGTGQYIDMAQLEIGTYLLGPAMIDYVNNEREAQPRGNVDGLADRVPNEVYPAADGFVALTANDDAMWARLARLVGLQTEWPIEERRTQRTEIDRSIGAWIAARTAADAVAALQGAEVAAGKVQDSDDLFRLDPQHRARGFWLENDHAVHGPRPFDRFPALWSRSDLLPYRSSPPYLGESNFDVWGDIAGLDPEAVAEGMGSGLFS